MERAFEAAARRWWEGWKINKTARYADYVLGQLVSDAFLLIGHVPVDELRSAHRHPPEYLLQAGRHGFQSRLVNLFERVIREAACLLMLREPES